MAFRDSIGILRVVLRLSQCLQTDLVREYQSKHKKSFPTTKKVFESEKYIEAEVEADIDLNSKWKMKIVPNLEVSSNAVPKEYVDQTFLNIIGDNSIARTNRNNFYGKTLTNLFSLYVNKDPV